MRRFTRLTKGRSEKLEKLHGGRGAPLHALQFRLHPPDAARDPGHEAGLTDRVWSIEDIIGLLEMAEKEPAA